MTYFAEDLFVELPQLEVSFGEELLPTFTTVLFEEEAVLLTRAKAALVSGGRAFFAFLNFAANNSCLLSTILPEKNYRLVTIQTQTHTEKVNKTRTHDDQYKCLSHLACINPTLLFIDYYSVVSQLLEKNQI